jgi:hypothetical protein
VPEFDSEAYVAAAAPAVGIELTEGETAEVAAQFTRIHAFARLVVELELAPEEEPAPRFES